MFFEKDYIIFNIIDVIHLKQKSVRTITRGRPFEALSFRLCADTYIKTKNEKFHLTDNAVTFVPSKFEYFRESAVDDLIVIHFNYSNYTSTNIESFTPKNPKKFATLFNLIFEVWNKKEVGFKYKCASILYEIFAECHFQNCLDFIAQSKIKKSVDFVLNNYTKDITITEIADKSFMSEVYFRKLFKKEFGVSPQQYLINLRLNYAIELMSTGYYSLKEIAKNSGYNDYKYFLTEFKKHFGVSPSTYQLKD